MTKNNWISTNLHNRTSLNLCEFDVTITPYYFKEGTFLDNSKLVAKELSENYENLYLCYSGGSDSEYILKIFLDTRLPIIPVIIDTPYNIKETKIAFEFCKNAKVKPEVMSYTKNEIVDLMLKKVKSLGLFTLLGAVPLIICDHVNKLNGSLITGSKEVFSYAPPIIPNVSYAIEFAEFDYYLDSYDNRHPSGFFGYDLALFYSMLKDIRYDIPIQQAKCELYGISMRDKIYWDKEFYTILVENIPQGIKNYYRYADKDNILTSLSAYAL
jgi:hypothetical protein